MNWNSLGNSAERGLAVRTRLVQNRLVQDQERSKIEMDARNMQATKVVHVI